MRFEESVDLPSPPERVWAVLADWERYHEWMPDVAWVKAVGPERGVGMRLLVRTKVFGLPLVTDRMVITAWDPPRKMAIRHEGPARGPAQWLLEPEGGGTRFTWAENIGMPPPVVGELALLAYSPVLRRTFRRSLRNLRGRLTA